MRLNLLIGPVILVVLVSIVLLANQPPKAVYPIGGDIIEAEEPASDGNDSINLTGAASGEEEVIATTPPPETTHPPTVTHFPTNTATTGGFIEYVDVSHGGTFETGDYVEFLGEKGVLAGNITDGEVTSPDILLIDENGKTRLDYQQIDHPTLGHLELIAYPQEGKVYLEIDGADSGYVFKWVKGVNFDHYISLYQYPNYPEVQQFILEKP